MHHDINKKGILYTFFDWNNLSIAKCNTCLHILPNCNVLCKDDLKRNFYENLNQTLLKDLREIILNGISPLVFDPLVFDPLVFDPLVFDPLVFIFWTL